MDPDVLLTGNLYCWLRGMTKLQWQKRFYVLRKTSPQAKARIDYYDNYANFEKNPKNCKTILLEKATDVRRTSTQGLEHSFEIHVSEAGKSHRLQFAADSAARLEEWLTALKQLDGIPMASTVSFGADHNDCHEESYSDSYVTTQPSVGKMYRVTVLETDAAKRCHLAVGQEIDSYILPENLVLIMPDRRALSWNYSHIRRYGCGNNIFTFEAGRKSASGEGRFSLQIPHVDQFYRDLKGQMKGMQSNDHPSPHRHQGSPVPGRHVAPSGRFPGSSPLAEYLEPVPVSYQTLSNVSASSSPEMAPRSNFRSVPEYSVPVKLKQTHESELAQVGDIAAADNPIQLSSSSISDLLDKIPAKTAPSSSERDLYDHIDLKNCFIDTERGSTTSDQCYGRLKPPYSSAKR